MPRTNPTSPFLTYLLLLLALHTKFSTQLNCYDVDGSIWSNNIQCPGSQSCCADVGQCTQNRLCAKEGTLVRGPCLNAQFDDCSPLCHYTNTRHMLPRVYQCPDGSYCCDNSPDCCNNGTGVLLSPKGKLISNTLSSTIISSTSSSTRATINTAVSSSLTGRPGLRASTESATVPTPTDAAGLGASALPSAVPAKKSTSKIKGIVIGVVVAVVVVVAIAALFILRQRRRIRKLETNLNGGQGPSYVYSELYAPVGPVQDGANPGQQTQPAEMRGVGIYDRVAELPTSPRRSVIPPTVPS